MRDAKPTANMSGRFEGIYGDPVEFKGKTIIAFLDLLGFSNRVIQHWSDSADHPVELYEKILYFAEDTQHTSVTNSSSPVRTYMPHVRLMSDSILINVALPENEADLRHDFGVASWCLFSIVRRVINTCLKMGFPIRGGIEHGDIFWNKRAMLGPALIRAYQIEQICDIGRIILGPNFIQSLPIQADGDAVDEKHSGLKAPEWFRQFYVTADGMAALRPFDRYDKSVQKVISALSKKYSGQPRIAAKYTDLIVHAGTNTDKDVPSPVDLERCESVIRKKLTL